ncbi:CatB-related O-acetyltransferase (plasmid) [Rhizobium lusitanum]|nr:CatB-related O-acetyltransferase [Rhizobium lusitanum]
MPDGNIYGYQSINLSAWGCENAEIRLYDSEGTLTARLNRNVEPEVVFEGTFIPRPSIRLRFQAKGTGPIIAIRPGTSQHFARQIEHFSWSIGDHTYGEPTVLEQGYAPLEIGRFTSIGPDVTIILANHSYNSATTYPFAYLSPYWPGAPRDAEDHTAKGAVVIGSDVWIGTRSIILSGVTIGDGAIIAAGSVVTRDVPPYEIHGGNPAKIIKRRHPQDIAAALQKIAWWNWTDEKIDRFLPLILNNDVHKFISQARLA